MSNTDKISCSLGYCIPILKIANMYKEIICVRNFPKPFINITLFSHLNDLMREYTYPHIFTNETEATETLWIYCDEVSDMAKI